MHFKASICIQKSTNWWFTLARKPPFCLMQHGTVHTRLQSVSQSIDRPTKRHKNSQCGQPVITAATTTPDTKRAGQVVVTEEVSVSLEGWQRNARATEGVLKFKWTLKLSNNIIERAFVSCLWKVEISWNCVIYQE